MSCLGRQSLGVPNVHTGPNVHDEVVGIIRRRKQRGHRMQRIVLEGQRRATRQLPHAIGYHGRGRRMHPRLGVGIVFRRHDPRIVPVRRVARTHRTEMLLGIRSLCSREGRRSLARQRTHAAVRQSCLALVREPRRIFQWEQERHLAPVPVREQREHTHKAMQARRRHRMRIRQKDRGTQEIQRFWSHVT